MYWYKLSLISIFVENQHLSYPYFSSNGFVNLLWSPQTGRCKFCFLTFFPWEEINTLLLLFNCCCVTLFSNFLWYNLILEPFIFFCDYKRLKLIFWKLIVYLTILVGSFKILNDYLFLHIFFCVLFRWVQLHFKIPASVSLISYLSFQYDNLSLLTCLIFLTLSL
jgi:hypothetical protein